MSFSVGSDNAQKALWSLLCGKAKQKSKLEYELQEHGAQCAISTGTYGPRYIHGHWNSFRVELRARMASSYLCFWHHAQPLPRHWQNLHSIGYSGLDRKGVLRQTRDREGLGWHVCRNHPWYPWDFQAAQAPWTNNFVGIVFFGLPQLFQLSSIRNHHIPQGCPTRALGSSKSIASHQRRSFLNLGPDSKLAMWKASYGGLLWSLCKRTNSSLMPHG